MDSLQWIEHFHLIRPYWLLALIPLALIIWFYAHSQSQNHSWASIIDKRLLNHLLHDATAYKKKPTPVIGLFLLGFIIIFALAGPAYEKRPQPVFKNQSALVIILDLSRSMDSTDIKPTRLSRAHFKINDIINTRQEGQTALIVYAAGAYVVSPLTDDADTIAAQVSALETSIMPAQGSRLYIALDKARLLFQNAGQAKGDILVITDSITDRDIKRLKELSDLNYTTSFLAVGTEEGAPITNRNGGFVKDKTGKIVIPQLDINKIKKAALSTGGKFSLLSANDNDINHLLSLINNKVATQQSNEIIKSEQKLKTDLWHEEGPWLILLIIPFAAYAFRKGFIFLLIIFILPIPQPAQALEWSELWKNKNQQGKSALQQGDAEHAADLFENPEWKAAAQYKAGKFEESANLLKNIDTADANYNRGNALARAGDIENAIKAYDQTLTLNPEHEDAKFNKKLLEDNQKENSEKSQSPEDDDKQKKDSEDKKSKENKNKDKDSNKNKNKNNESKDNNSKDKDSDDGDSADKKPNESKSDSGEDKGNKSEEQKDQQKNPASKGNDKKKQSSKSKKIDDDAAKNQPQDKELTDAEKNRNPEENDDKDKHQFQPKNEDNKNDDNKDKKDDTPDLKQQQTQQWLKKIPDDPGGLLRRKFKYQYGQQRIRDEDTPW